MLAAAVLFATGGAAIKLSTLPTAALSGLRCGVAALVLLAAVPSWRRGYTPRVLAVGLAYAATLTLFVAATQRTTAASAIFLQSTAPLYVLLLAPRLLGERVDRAALGSGAVIAVGLGLIFVGRSPPLGTAPEPLLGDLLGAAAGLAWALTLLGLRAGARAQAGQGDGAAGDPGPAVIAGNALGFLFCLPWMFPLPAFSAQDASVVLYLGTVQIGLAYVLLVRGVRRVAAFEVSLLLLLEPVLSAVFAWAVHAEAPGRLALLGGGLVLAASAGHTTWSAVRGRPDQDPVEV